MKALVTGGRGFVGRWLCDHLRACGDEVVATGEEVDVAKSAALLANMQQHEPEAIYHLAGQAHVGTSWKELERTYLVNTLGTVNVLDAARRVATAPRVLVVSSAEVYGIVKPDDLPLREDAPTQPVSPYAGSKLAAEVAAQQAARGHGQHVVIARPFNHIGPGQSTGFVVSDIAKRVADAEGTGDNEVRIGNATPRRDFTDVRDVVRAYRLLIEHGEPGCVYNVGTGDDVMIGDLAKRLIDMSTASLSLVTDAVDLRPVDIPVLRADTSRLRATTGWEPEVPLERTLADVLAWWRDH